MKTGKQWREETRAKKKREEEVFREGLRRTREERRKFEQAKWASFEFNYEGFDPEEFWRNINDTWNKAREEFKRSAPPPRKPTPRPVNGAYVSDKVKDTKKRDIILALRAKGLDKAVTADEKAAYLAKAKELEEKYSI